MPFSEIDVVDILTVDLSPRVPRSVGKATCDEIVATHVVGATDLPSRGGDLG